MNLSLARLADVGAINRRMLAAELEAHRLRELLLSLKTGDCWCGMGIGNPNYRDHADSCKAVQAVFSAGRRK